ncbi:MAG TPA: AsmA family protein, partial [Phenylobacterium sp.]|uniref:AsmA family protein n=1 Tax=Phenylobacterium sp. TaxID=1871053 RepID=UPI002F945EC1
MAEENASKTNRLRGWFKDHRKPLLWTGGIFAALVAGVVVVLAVLDWNMLRGPISRYASERTGREVAIDGDLDVNILSWKPTASVNGLRIGNPAWAGKGRMAEIRRLDVQVELLPLLRGQVILPRLVVDQPNLALVRDRQGRANWSFDRDKPEGEPFRFPPIRYFGVENGRLKFSDARRRLTLDARIQAAERQGRAGRGFVLDGRGSINGAPFTVDVTGGPLLNVRPNRPYPFDANVRAGATRFTAKGSIPRPFDLRRFTADFTARGADLSDLYDLTGVALPNTPPYRLAGKLSREDEMWKIAALRGHVGDSDMSGVLSVDTGGERPFLRGDLKSRLLDFDDLAAIFGGAPASGGGETAS